MGLREDISEAKNLWAGSSFLAKVFIIGSVFMTASSITSLSDVVFGWKGFILDGVHFYQEYIRAPLIRIAQIIGLDFSNRAADVLTVVWILLVANISHVRATLNIHIDSRLGANWHTATSVLVGIVITHNLSSTYDGSLIITIILIIVGTIMPGLVAYYHGIYRAYYFGPVALSIAIVLVLGAINVGLTR